MSQPPSTSRQQGRATLAELSGADDFARRHIGPDHDEQAQMLAALGLGSLDELLDAAVPPSIRMARAAGAARRSDRGRRAGRAARPRGTQPGAHLAHRHGLLRHRHAPGDPAQPPGEPRLVHRLHAVPARDQPGAARGPAQLPDDGERPHRHGSGQRLHARRGHRGGRGDGHGPPALEERQRRVPRRCRHPSPDGRGAPDEGRAGGHRGGGRRPRRGRHAAGLRRPALATRARPGGSGTGGRSSSGCRRAAASSWWRRTCWRWSCWRRPVRGGPTSSWGRRSASACRSASVAPTPRSWPRATPTPAASPAAWSASAPTPRAGTPCAWPCRRVSSTSAASAPPATSAPRRCCWPTSPACTPCGTAPTACAASRERVHRLTGILARGLRDGGVEVVHDSHFDTITVRVPGRAAEVAAAARERGINLRPVDDDTLGVSLDETTTPAVVADVWEAFGVTASVEALDDTRRGCAARRPATLRRGAHPSGVPPLPQRARAAPLPAPPGRQGPRARPDDDPARLVHHEAQRRGGDAADHVARAGRRPSLRPRRPGRGLPRDDPAARGHAPGLHRLRRGEPATQRRQPGRAGRAARHPRLPPEPGRRRSGPSASSRPRPTAPTPPAPSWRACRWWWWRATTPATSTSTTCGPRSTRPGTAWRRSWSPTRRPTASSRRASPTCARSSTRPAGRCTWTAPTSTPWWAWPSRAGSVPT